MLTGHVESISAGIADRERSDSPELLANINPTFTWVRLAQRVPVRVKLDGVPLGVQLVLGRTATVYAGTREISITDAPSPVPVGAQLRLLVASRSPLGA